MKKYITISIIVVLAASIVFSGCRTASGDEKAITDTIAEETELQEKEAPDEEAIDENGEDKETV